MRNEELKQKIIDNFGVDEKSKDEICKDFETIVNESIEESDKSLYEALALYKKLKPEKSDDEIKKKLKDWGVDLNE